MKHPLMWIDKVPEIFDQYAILHHNRPVFPQKLFEELFQVNLGEHPLFFRPEVFIGGEDWNSWWENGEKVFAYLTFRGFCKAVSILNAEALLQDRPWIEEYDEEPLTQAM